MKNRYKWLLAVVIILAITAYADFQEPIQPTFQPSALSPEIKQSCEEKAAQLIPHNVTMRKDGSTGWMMEQNNWSDGLGVGHITQQYNVGGQPGQNVNFYYGGTGNPMTYRKKIVDGDGTILGERAFNIYPVLRPINDTYNERKLESGYFISTQLFEIMEYKFSKCDWVE